MEKILFIMLPDYQLEVKSSAADWRPPFLCVPYGIISIAGYIRKYVKRDLDMQVFNLNEILYEYAISDQIDVEGLFDKIEVEIKQRIEDFKPDMIACSTLFNACFAYVDTVVKSIEASGFRGLLLFGGKVATNHYEAFLESFERIDAVCFAEGEVPFFQLLHAEDYEEELERNLSFITRNNISEEFKPQAYYVDDLDQIPIFAFDLLDMEKYIGKYYESCKFASAKYLDSLSPKERGLYIISTRGCPYNCVFCCSHSIHGKKIRYRSADSIINEIIMLKDRFNLDLINFQDDNFFNNKERAIEILDRLIELDLGLKYEFANGIITYRVDDDIVSRLKKIGIPGMTLAIESGSERVLRDIIQKPLQVPIIYRAVDTLKKHGLRVYASFVFGFPGETEEDRQKSLDLIKNIGFDWIHLFAAIPFSGSRLYDICMENHYIDGQQQELLNARKYSAGIINTPDFTAEYINKFIYYNNLNCNFIENYNYRSGNYAIAITFFEDILVSYPRHAFAHYMIWKCMEKIEQSDKKRMKQHKDKFYELIETDVLWRDYADQFHIMEG